MCRHNTNPLKQLQRIKQIPILFTFQGRCMSMCVPRGGGDTERERENRRQKARRETETDQKDGERG